MCSMESCLQLYLYTNKWITANYLTAPEFLTIKSKIRHVKPRIKNNNNKYIDTLIQLRTLASVAVTGSAKANRRLTFQTGNFDQLNRDVKNKLLFFVKLFSKKKKNKATHVHWQKYHIKKIDISRHADFSSPGHQIADVCTCSLLDIIDFHFLHGGTFLE